MLISSHHILPWSILAFGLAGCGSGAIGDLGPGDSQGGPASTAPGSDGAPGAAESDSEGEGDGEVVDTSSDSETVVRCATPSTCPGEDNACQTRTCIDYHCGMAFAPSGATVATQSAGDCQVLVCDGAGATISIADPSDIADDGNACTEDVCSAGAPAHPASPAGASCAQGGAVCDGAGACVECVTGSDCASGVCVQHACAPVPPPPPPPPACPATTGINGGESTNIVASCSLPPLPAPGAVHLATDVTYTSPGGTPVKLDVAWPLGTGVHPLVVLIHGGSWYGGAKALHYDDMLLLAGQGYVATTIDYRVSKYGHTFPEQESDTRCAIRYLRAHAAAYHIDPKRIAVVGESAGAHLAAQLGVQSDDDALDDGTCALSGDVRPKAVVAYYGIYDLTSSTGLGPLAPKATTFLGGTPESNPAKAITASPIKHLDSCDTPFLFTVGTNDSIVPSKQTTAMKNAVRAAGLPATQVTISGADHGYGFFAPGLTLAASCTTLHFLATKL